MLIQFRFKNYKSFKEETILDMSATSQREHSDFLIEKNGNKVLPAAVFWGGNASGKSNFVEAFLKMMACILLTYDFYTEKSLPVMPYIFGNEIFDPTAFEIVLAIGETEYKYGFILDDKRIYQEWLLYRPFNKTSTADYKKLFERTDENIILYGQFKNYEELKTLVKEKNLFFSMLGRRKDNIVSDIYNWFYNIRFEMINENRNQDILENLDNNKKLFEQIKREIRKIDPCIYDMKILKRVNELNKEEDYELKTVHKFSDGRFIKCFFNMESDGTQKLFYLYYKIYNVLNNGGILFIDELDSKIHSLALNHIIYLFNNRETNKNNAQIIFTCHNTWFLDNKLLRRDQIWFISKNEDGVSEMYSLSDFKDVRNDLDYSKAYLSGKFGAIPYMERGTNGKG